MDNVDNISILSSYFEGENSDVLRGDTGEDWKTLAPVSYKSHLTLGVFMIPVTILAVGGNGLVIWIFVRFRSLRTPPNILVINLALSDFLMASTGYPMFVAASFEGQWTFGRKACEFYGMTGAWFALMSINSMVAIALDRYLIIYKSYKITFKQCYIWLVVIWLYSLFWALPPLFGWSRYSTEGYGTTCSYDYFISDPDDKYFLMSVVIGDFVLPLFAICYCYVFIMCKFRAHQQKYGSLLRVSKSSQSENKRNSSEEINTTELEKKELMKSTKQRSLSEKFKTTEFKIARTVIFVIIAFGVSWTPYAVVCLVGQYGNRKLISPDAAMIPVIVAKLGAIYNPFIYSLTHPRFKQALRKTMPCCVHVGEAPIKRSQHQAFRARMRYRDAEKAEAKTPQYVISLRSPRACLPATEKIPVTESGHKSVNFGQVIDCRASKEDSMETKQGSQEGQRIVSLRNLEENVTLRGCTDANDFLVKWLCEAAKGTPDGKVVLCLKNYDSTQ